MVDDSTTTIVRTKQVVDGQLVDVPADFQHPFRDETRDYGMTRPLTDERLGELVLGDGWIKVPMQLVGELGTAADPTMMDAAIVAGFILRQWELLGYSPTMRTLRDFLGRSNGRVHAAVLTLHRLGWIRARKVKYAPHKWKWRFEMPVGSPLHELRRGSKAPGIKWRAMPLEVARSRSTLVPTAFLVLSEMVRREGVIVTTPTQLARLLRCSRSTADRTLRALGARRVGRSDDGSLIYTWNDGTQLTYAWDSRWGRLRAVDEAACRKWSDRLGAIVDTLDGGRPVDAQGNTDWSVASPIGNPAHAGTDALVSQLVQEHDGDVRRVVRVLEETHLPKLLRSQATRGKILACFSWRIRQGLRAAPAAVAGAKPPKRQRAHSHAELIAQAVRTESCRTCDGTGWDHRNPDASGGVSRCACVRRE